MTESTGSWIWATGSPRERADMVRRHIHDSRLMGEATLCELFDLTPAGFAAIRDGGDWRPEYERPAINLIEEVVF